MDWNIKSFTLDLQAEINNYKEKFDSIIATQERELAEIKQTLIPNTPKYHQEQARIKGACKDAIGTLRKKTIVSISKSSEEFRTQIIAKVRLINKDDIDSIKSLQGIPLSQEEFKVIVDKYSCNNYWNNRLLAVIGEENGVDFGGMLETSLDVKLSVLNQLVEQSDKVLKYYGDKSEKEEDRNARYLYLNDEVVNSAIRMFSGTENTASPSEQAEKAYLQILSGQTDISRGLSIANALGNIKGDGRNELLALIKSDNRLSDLSKTYSGYSQEIADFNESEYIKAKDSIDKIKTIKDDAIIKNLIGDMQENTFFSDMLASEIKNNPQLREMVESEQALEE